MNKLYFLLPALMLSAFVFAGDGRIPGRMQKSYAVFSLKDESKSTDSIRFVVTAGDTLKKKKGIILFLQGSEPVPLFTETAEGIAPPLPFNEKPFLQDFRFVIISKPGIPLAHFYQANESFIYLDPVTHDVPVKYQENDNLQWYTQSADHVINYLATQPWVQKEKIMVIGHSQGSRVASYLCTKNKLVKKIAFLSCGAFARTYNFTSDIRRADGNEKQEQAQVDTLLGRMAGEFTPGAADGFYNHHPIDDLVKLNIPVLLLYGLGDTSIQPETLDLVVMEFRRRGKKNLEWKPLPGYNHNFFMRDQSGNFTDFRWDEIAAEVIGWMKK